MNRWIQFYGFCEKVSNIFYWNVSWYIELIRFWLWNVGIYLHSDKKWVKLTHLMSHWDSCLVNRTCIASPIDSAWESQWSTHFWVSESICLLNVGIFLGQELELDSSNESNSPSFFSVYVVCSVFWTPIIISKLVFSFTYSRELDERIQKKAGIWK